VESSKKIRGKITPFGERIIKILKDNKLVKQNGDVNFSQAERICKIKGSALSKAVRANSMHDGNLEKFLGKFHVEREWLLNGIGPEQLSITNRNHASDINIDEQPVIREQKKDPAVDDRILKKLDSLTDNVNSFGDFNRFLLKEIDRLQKKIIDLGGEI
jgi:hypothetical protein